MRVIAAVNGYAFGGGFETRAGVRYHHRHENAKLGLPEAKLGLLRGAVAHSA